MFSEVIDRLAGITDTELSERIAALELQRRATEAELAACIGEAEARQINAIDGHRTMKGYLKATCNWSNRDVTTWRALARVTRTHRDVGEAWILGRIGQAQVNTLATVEGNRRVRDQFERCVPLLTRNAEEFGHDDFAVIVKRFVHQADSDGAHDRRDDALTDRNAHVTDLNGSLQVTSSGGDPLTSAEITAIFERFCEAEFQRDVAARTAEHGDDALNHDLPRTARQRRFDALVEVFRVAGQGALTGTPTAPAKAVVNIIIDDNSFARMQAAAGLSPDTAMLDELMTHPEQLLDRCCETESGTQLHPHDVLRAALDGHVRRVVVDRAGTIIDFGREQRLFTGSARAAAKLLVRHCQHPGCDLPTDMCEVDHNEEWFADGGATDQANANIECAGHNRFKSRKRYRTRRSRNGGTYTVRPDGSIVLPVGARVPVFDNDIDDDPWWRSDEYTDADEYERVGNLARARIAALVS